jgi:hypothetical protein
MKIIIALITILTLTATTEIAKADSFVDVTGVTSWTKASSKSIILYEGRRAIAVVELWDPVIFSSAAEVLFLGEEISMGDKVVVDGETVEIRKVQKIR